MNQEHMPPTRFDALFSTMKESYKSFLTACEGLSESQALKEGVCGGWSAKAVVDHLTGWQVESHSIVKSLLAADSTAFDVDIDAFNSTSVQDREAFSWDESLQGFEDSFTAFTKLIEGIPEKVLSTNDGLTSWVKAMTHEYQFHLQHIQNTE